MRKHIFLFFSALIFLGACMDSTPGGIIKRDKMINLMIDMHIVDGSLYNIDAPNADSLYKYGTGRYNTLFKRHHTDPKQFDNSLKYYSMHPEEMEEMYTDIVKKLQAKSDSLNNLPNSTKANALPSKYRR